VVHVSGEIGLCISNQGKVSLRRGRQPRRLNRLLLLGRRRICLAENVCGGMRVGEVVSQVA